jgi:superfamily I DNA/RNA helicase
MPLSPSYLTPDQRAVIEQPLDARLFLSGPAGTGKTTVGVERVLHLLENGVPGNQILLLVPQRTLATPYYDALHSPNTPAGGAVSILTVGGLARRMVDLFWPIVAEEAGFTHPDLPPTFLTLETAQYYMAHLVRPLLAEGYFDSLSLDRNRLYSQIVDNLNKAAVHGFPHTEIGERLKSAWVGDPGQTRIYEDAQYCAGLFRQFCLDHNLLDFSLQLEIFLHQLWSAPLCREYLVSEYRHLIFDNLEEDTPIAADLLQEWLPEFDSVLLIYDTDAGYRRFLGADPDSMADLAHLLDIQTRFTEGFVSSENVAAFGFALANALNPEGRPQLTIPNSPFTVKYPLPAIRFHPEMLDWVADQIVTLVDGGTPPGEIVILAPYLSDALRYALVDRLDRLGIPSRSHRPSRSLREEPSTRCLLTLAKLAHPQWGLNPHKSDLAYALMQAIADLDLVRAQLLVEIIYRKGQLSTFDAIKPEVQERITYLLGERYEHLRLWLADYAATEPQELDHFLSRLFGEVLSQPGYGFHVDYVAGSMAANLVESVQKFRWVAGEVLASEGVSLGREYLQMVEDGVIAAQYLLPWQTEAEDAVFMAPAYTFLMANRPVDYQFWLDVGGRGWYERLYQPLTHPHVLNRHWPIGQPWTDVDETAASQDALYRLALGLVRRCRQGIFLGLSELGEQGYEHKGELLRAIDRALRAVA